MNFIVKRLGVERKELDKLTLLILHSFFSAIFLSIYFSVSNAEFVNNFGNGFLPVGYLLSGAVGYITVQGYGRLLKKSGYSAFVRGLVFLLVATLFFRCAFFFAGPQSSKWISFVIFLFAMPFLAVSRLQQTGLLLKIYDIREGKKYAGIINAGTTLASIAGYLSIPLLTPFLTSIYDLFFIAILGIFISLLFLFKINKTLNLKDQSPSGPNQALKTDISLLSLLKQKYIRYIAIAGGISMMAFYFVDYSFLINLKAQANSPQELSSIMGGFFAFIKTAEFVLSLLSGRIFRSFGLKTGIILLPAICVFVTLCAILVHSFSGAGVFLFIIFSLKFFERILSKAIEEPAYKNLYQLLNMSDRLAIQAKIDGGTKQLFIIFGSMILLLYGSFMPSSQLKIGLLYISVPIFLFWLYSARQLVLSFKERLRDILNSGNSKNNSDTSSPFDHVRSAFLNTGGKTNSKDLILNLLSHKINVPAEKKLVKITEDAQGIYDSYVPAPFLKYLIPTPGHARLELQLYQPLLVIPPKGPAQENSETKSFEYLDEKDIIHFALSADQPDESTIKALGKKLDDLKQDHEKKLVLNILARSNHSYSTEILLNHLDYPDYYTRKQIFKTLETKNFKFSPKQEIYYRNSLEATLSDITYILSALSSLPDSSEFEDLVNALTEEESILKNRLLSILTWKYDRASIAVIRENIFSGNSATKSANNILTLELIDNLVENEIKPKIMPVFENGTYSWRLSSLNKWYNFPSLSLKETLITILHYDYTKIGIWAKACALKILLNEKNREYKHIISGFSYHPNALLRSLAHEYSETVAGNLIYPLYPKDESFLAVNSKNKLNNLKGMEIFNCLKTLKGNSFFKKVSFNDLIKFSFSIEFKNHAGFQELAALGNPKNKPFLILDGNVVLEFKKDLPGEIFSRNYIAPDQFDEGKISRLMARSQTSLYDFSSVHLANLLFTSDSLINSITGNNSE